MTSLPTNQTNTKLGLVIDLDICVGCHACAVNCKEWNAGGHSAPMTDWNTYSGTENKNGEDSGAWGVWFNRVHTFEVGKGQEVKPSTFQDLAYTVMNLHVLRSVQLAPLTRGKKME